MRTITRTYDLFQLAELSAAARDTAYNEWLRTFEYGWDSDNRNTLEAFESVFKVKVNDWSTTRAVIPTASPHVTAERKRNSAAYGF